METTTEKKLVELKVGDIVEYTSHYNSSRTSFYLIVGISKSGKKAQVKELGNTQVDGDWMNGNVTANLENVGTEIYEVMVKGQDWNGNQMLRGRINSIIRDKETGEVKWVNTGSIQNFYKWNGKPIWNNCD